MPEFTDEELEIARGNKILAIKNYRAKHGVGLLEAKNAVEAALNAPPRPPEPPISWDTGPFLQVKDLPEYPG